jgi:hypothetical protein
MERDRKISEIENLFSQLYCFTADEALGYIKAARNFPDSGLVKLIRTLKQGKKQQDEFLAGRIEENKGYVKNLDGFLKKTTNKLKGGYEKAEHKQAESFLKNL